MQTDTFDDGDNNSGSPGSEELIDKYYRPLYQFALSLTHSESDACDLTQNTFYTWQTKGEQLRDPSKAKAWLFTTMHRAFLQGKRREARFPHFELDELDAELPWIWPHDLNRVDAANVIEALSRIDANFRAPLALFYLEDYPYKEIAQILRVPLGTVKSRISRGIAQLQKLLAIEDECGRPPVACLSADDPTA